MITLFLINKDIMFASSMMMSNISNISNTNQNNTIQNTNVIQVNKVPNINRNNNVIIWCRVSSVQQQNSFSLAMQEELCRQAVGVGNSSAVKMVILSTGSGFNLKNDIKAKYEMFFNFRNPIVVCLSVDRFCRNVEYGKYIYEKIKSQGGRIYFMIDNLDTLTNEQLFLAKLEIAQKESQNKSERMKLNNKFLLNARVQASANLDTIYQFVKSMIDGDQIQNIYSHFRIIVDWNSHADWKDLYNSPIEFDNIHRVCGVPSILRGDITFKTIANILNDYEVPVCIEGVRNKKWNDKLIEAIYNRSNIDRLLEFLVI